MTANATAPAPRSSIWRWLWSFIQAAERSSAESQDLRIDALERRVARLQEELQERARSPAVAFQENLRGRQRVAIGAEVQAPQSRRT
jgi:hypothetical protein